MVYYMRRRGLIHSKNILMGICTLIKRYIQYIIYNTCIYTCIIFFFIRKHFTIQELVWVVNNINGCPLKPVLSSFDGFLIIYYNVCNCIIIILIALFRFSLWSHFWQTKRLGITGNMKGDGTLLGACLVIGKGQYILLLYSQSLLSVIGPGNDGIVYQYLSKEFGDSVNTDDVMEAVRLMRL